MLGVVPLLGGCLLVYGGGRFVALSFALMHGTVLLVAPGGVVSGTPARLDGPFSGELGAALGRLGPPLGRKRVFLMAVHGAVFPTAGYPPAGPGAIRANETAVASPDRLARAPAKARRDPFAVRLRLL